MYRGKRKDILTVNKLMTPFSSPSHSFPLQCFLPPKAEELLSYDFDRIGRLQFKGGRSLERSTVGWFSLCKTKLYTYVEQNDMVEVINLKKLSELCT